MMSLSAKVTNMLLAPKPTSLSLGVSSVRKHLRYFGPDPSDTGEAAGFIAAAMLSLVGINAADNAPARAIPAAPPVNSITNPRRVVSLLGFWEELIAVSPLN